MEYINKMKVVIPAKSVNEGFARNVVGAFIAQLDPTVETLQDVKTAVSEAVTNAIIHGYEQGEGDIVIEAFLYTDSVEILIKDEGRGIEDIALAMQPMYTSKPEDDRPGIGFTVMENFMDEIKVISEVGKGTTVIMKKNLGNDE